MGIKDSVGGLQGAPWGAPLVPSVEGSRAVGMLLTLFNIPASPAPSQGMFPGVQRWQHVLEVGVLLP